MINLRLSGAITAVAGAGLLLVACGTPAVEPGSSGPPSAETTAPSSPAPVVPLEPTPQTQLLTGTFTVRASDLFVDHSATAECVAAGSAGLEDIHAGTQVTVYDGAQAIVAVSALSAGTLAEVVSSRQVPDRTDEDPDGFARALENAGPSVEGIEAAVEAYEASLPQITRFWGPCQFTFEAEVPEADFYSVEVAHRGKVSFARADLEASSWHVDLGL